MATDRQLNQRGDMGRRRARRDEDLKRLNGMTKTLAVGSVAAIGVVSGFVAHAIPGHAATNPSSGSASSGGSQPSTPSSGSANPGSASPSQGSSTLISPPSSAPQPTRSAPQTSSGSTGW